MPEIPKHSGCWRLCRSCLFLDSSFPIPMPRTLIAYSTVDGHTLKICDRIRKGLEANGHDVALFDIGVAGQVVPAAFDQVVVGASIRYGKYRPAVFAFIESHRTVLERVPSAFFSVNVVARKPGKDTAQSNPYIRLFHRETSWRPTEIGVFAGRLDYPRYRLLDRLMIRFIMWLTHGPTDPMACVEFTDWNAVDQFARRLASLECPIAHTGSTVSR